jgi:hypothetical protein
MTNFHGALTDIGGLLTEEQSNKICIVSDKVMKAEKDVESPPKLGCEGNKRPITKAKKSKANCRPSSKAKKEEMRQKKERKATLRRLRDLKEQSSKTCQRGYGGE